MDTQTKGTPFDVIATAMDIEYDGHKWPMMITERRIFIDFMHPVLAQEYGTYKEVPFSLKLIMECAHRNLVLPQMTAYNIFYLGSGGNKLKAIWTDPKQVENLPEEEPDYHLINLRPNFPNVFNTLAKPMSLGKMAQAMLFLDISKYRYIIEERTPGENPFSNPPIFDDKYLILENGKFALKPLLEKNKTQEGLIAKNYWEVLED